MQQMGMLLPEALHSALPLLSAVLLAVRDVRVG
jgi:hypothetical protein